MSVKRMAAGSLAMFATAWGLSALFDLVELVRYVPNGTISPLVWLCATFVGALVARRNFMPVALLAWLVIWVVVLYILYAIAAPTGQASLPGLLRFNAVGMAATLAANAVGTLLGERASRTPWSRSNNSSKPTPLRGAA